LPSGQSGLIEARAEYDDLVSGVGAALALATTLKKHSIAGRIVLLGTPAEETDGGKIKLLKANAYRDMDVCRVMTTASP
jgi:metal-dependent amidase/aminoacylase/carboxypeptidase family protein